MVNPGTYTAKLVNYGLAEPREGKQMPEVVLTFEVNDHGEAKQIQAYKHLTEKAIKYTLKDLLTLGMRSDELASLTSPGAFDGREVSIVVEHEEYDGKKRAKVKWINSLSKFKAMHPLEALTVLGQFSPMIKGLRQELNIPNPKSVTDFEDTSEGVVF